MIWITVNLGGRVRLWCEDRPHYFLSGAWVGPHSWVATNSGGIEMGGWPDLKEYAESLGLEPGPEGIAEITIDMKRVPGE